MNLPTGTVTFLFTDIEGSTQLWENHPETMRAALTRHDALLREAVDQNNGVVFKTTGDGIAAAFPVAPKALAAALAAQQALGAEPWPTETVMRVRMGLHTGAAEYRDGDYFGQVLNRVARLMAAGHGGQVLFSGVTQELCRDYLPAGVSLVSMGEHRLKDLTRPETIFQLIHSDLPAPDSFPPLRTLDNPELPNNLPQQVNNFIGREKQIGEVVALLNGTGRETPGTLGTPGTRLLTLVGTGGTGKTRLSLQVAAEVLGPKRFPNGAWFVELAPLSDPLLVPQAVAQALGVREKIGQTLTQTLSDFLKPKRLLLLLDNCEHLITACATLTTALLSACPGLTILATSREPLNVRGEQSYRVPSLALPTMQQSASATPESLSAFDAVLLFIDRALLVKQGFEVTNANAPALAQICSRLDGIPLAIELAAARVRSLSVEQINERLGNRFRLLTSGDRSALPRQQTLRALIDWSYDLLSEIEKMLLARLSVFAGGWTLEAAESVCGFDPLENWDVLDHLSSLVDKSLVLADVEEDGANRYQMLETLRQYATEKRETSGIIGETATVQARRVAFFVALAEETKPKLRGQDQAVWLNRLETEHDNLRASLTACASRAIAATAASAAMAEPDAMDAPTAALSGLRLSGALERLWNVRGYLTEGREQLGRFLALRQIAASGVALGLTDALTVNKAVADALDAAGVLEFNQGNYDLSRSQYEESLNLYREIDDMIGVAITLNGLGNVASAQGDYASARSYYEESLSISREIGNERGIAVTLNGLGSITYVQGNYDLSRSQYEESLSLSREIGNKSGVAIALANLGNVTSAQGNYDLSRSQYEESLSLYREIGDKRSIAHILTGLGHVTSVQEDYASARSYYEESLSLSRQLGNKDGIAHSLHGLGGVSMAGGDYALARSQNEESVRVFHQIGDKRGVAFGLESLARVSGREGDWRPAVVLIAATAAGRESFGAPLPPLAQSDIEEKLAQAQEALGQPAFDAAWSEGAALSWEQAVEHALSTR